MSGQYYLDLYDPHGKRHRKSLHTDDLRLAKAIFKREREQIFRKAYDLPTEDEELQSLLGAYLAKAKQRMSPGWFKETERRLGEFFQVVTVARAAQVRRDDIVRWRDHRFQSVTPRGQPISRGGVAKDEQCVRALFAWAVRVGRLRQDPFHGLPKLKPNDNGEIDYLSDDEVKELLDHCAAPVALRGRGGKGTAERKRITPLLEIVVIAIFAGLRLAEILFLDWPDLDFERNEILVRSKAGEGHQTKTRRDRRVPMFARVREVMEPRRQDSGPCFCTRSGSRYGGRNLLRELDRILERMPPREPKINFITMRHTFATQLVSHGVSLYAVSKWLGHSSITTTEKHYAGFVPTELVVAQAAEALDHLGL
ncbi:tyrosine-type recombinase/integrase [Planctomycetota bacterium]